MTILAILIGTATGIISGFGIGGGSVLVLYLTTFADVAQHTAGGINLLYFIGCAPAALYGHVKNKQVDVATALWCAVGGIAAAIPLSLLGNQIDSDLIRRLFGILLIYVGIKEWRAARPPT